MTRCVDLAVVGGGPAGLAAAITAARAGWSAVVFEPRPAPVDKACGEGIMPGGVAELRDLGIRGLEGRPFTGVRYLDARGRRSAEGSFPAGPGLAVRRVALHEALLRRAAALGVRFREERVERLRVDPDEVRVQDLRARWLVGADGLHSRVRAALGVALPPRHAPRFGIRRHFATPPWTDRVEVYLTGGAEAYVTPLAGGIVGVAILFEGHGRFDELLTRFPAVAERLAGAPAVSDARGAGPFEQRVRRRSLGRVALVGDAAGYLDALTGEGVALGIATGRVAVECMRSGHPDEYEARYRALTRRYALLTSALRGVVRVRALHAPLLAIARRAPWAFDAALAALADLRERPAEVAPAWSRASTEV